MPRTYTSTTISTTSPKWRLPTRPLSAPGGLKIFYRHTETKTMSVTPLLNREQPLPEGKKKRRWLPWLVGPIIGALFIWWAETGEAADTVASITLCFRSL
jgi:hypothetical protein